MGASAMLLNISKELLELARVSANLLKASVLLNSQLYFREDLLPGRTVENLIAELLSSSALGDKVRSRETLA